MTIKIILSRNVIYYPCAQILRYYYKYGLVITILWAAISIIYVYVGARSSRRRRTCTLYTGVRRCACVYVCARVSSGGISFASDHRNIVDRPEYYYWCAAPRRQRVWCRWHRRRARPARPRRRRRRPGRTAVAPPMISRPSPWPRPIRGGRIPVRRAYRLQRRRRGAQ